MRFKYGDAIRRTRKYIGGTLVVAGIASMVFVGVNGVRQSPAHAAVGDFTFAVASDFDLVDEEAGAVATMAKIGQANPDFLFLNGDFAQANPPGATTFCSDINSNVSKPVFLVGGNHDTEDGGSGYRVSDYISSGCSQPTIGSITNFQSGSYGQDYYVDYPATSPKVRIIAISPELSLGNDYSTTSPRYAWVSSAIDTAKTNGEWVVVAFHKPYLNAGGRHGGSGDTNPEEEQDIFNLAVGKKADLIVNGHEHNYMRSKQLATNSTTCTSITRGSYNGACVGTGGPNYTKDSGTVEIISLGAGSLNGGNGYDSGSGDADFFATHVDGLANGYMSYSVTDTTLTGTLMSSSGATLDTFTITAAPSGDTTDPTVSFAAPTEGATISGSTTLTATALDNVGIARVEFFYDNGIYIGESTASPYTLSWDTSSAGGDGTHMLIAKAYDAAGNMAITTITVTVNNTTPPSGDTTKPTVNLWIKKSVDGSVSGNVTLSATASDASGIEKVEFYRGTTLIGTVTSEPYDLPWDSTTVANGDYDISAKAYDTAGNYTSTPAMTITVNNSTTPTPGSTSFTVKNIDDTAKTSSIDIGGTCTQSVAGTESVAPASIKSAITGFSFTSDCTAASGAATVTINLGAEYDVAKVHVYKEMSDKSIKDITADSKIENGAIGGKSVTVVSYSVKDGDAGDLDGKADGKIVDPVYVTSEAEALVASTGSNIFAIMALGSISILIGYKSLRKLSRDR